MRNTLAGKLFLIYIPYIIIVLSLLTGIILLQINSVLQTNIHSELIESARVQANQIDKIIEKNISSVRTVKTSLEQIPVTDRGGISQYFKQVLLQSPELVGVYGAFEPDSFNQKDQPLSNTPGNNSSGRFFPYWNRLSGQVDLDIYQNSDPTDLYQTVKTNQVESILEPGIFKNILICRIVEPVIKDGKFIGMTGIDINLSEVQKQVKLIDDPSGILGSSYALVTSNKGRLLSYPDGNQVGNKTLQDLGDIKNNPSFKKMSSDIGNGQEGWIESIMDPYSGKPSIMAYTPISSTGWTLIVVAPVDQVMTQRDHLAVILLINSILWLLVLLVIVGLVTVQLTKPLKALVETAKKIARGDLDVEIQKPSGDEIGQANKAFNQLTIYLRQITQAANQIADGDLSTHLIVKSDQDTLGVNFNRMTHNLQHLVNELMDEGARLQSASEKLAISSQQTGLAASQISTTIQQISKGVTASTDSISNTATSIDLMTRSINGIAGGALEQAKAVDQASLFTSQLTEVINRVNGNASVVVSEATRAADVARSGSNKVNETVQGMETIQSSVDLSAQKVKEMSQRTLQIENIIDAIDTIASQTNLLALNAAIEAARAGIHGKGFAVVADEVRKLSNRASDSTREIASIIASIRESLNEAVSAMDGGLKQVENGVNRAHEAGEALAEILSADEAVAQRASGTLKATEKMRQLSNELTNAMGSVSAVVEQNTATTAEMSMDSNKVSQAIENIASISEENCAAVEQVSATAQELSNQAADLSKAATELSQMATKVSGLISRFKV